MQQCKLTFPTLHLSQTLTLLRDNAKAPPSAAPFALGLTTIKPSSSPLPQRWAAFSSSPSSAAFSAGAVAVAVAGPHNEGLAALLFLRRWATRVDGTGHRRRTWHSRTAARTSMRLRIRVRDGPVNPSHRRLRLHHRRRRINSMEVRGMLE